MSRPFSVEACDFSGWATRNDLKCSDGRVIRRDALRITTVLKSRWSGIISTTVLAMFSVMHGLRTVRKVFTPTAFSMTPLMAKLRRSLLSTVTSVLCPFTPISFSRLVLMCCMAVFAR